ncbi:hypothetical protein SAMN02927921_03753 [Sinomicrobium oceani]|uniref:Uncharacterized protein n=2 Tax=Sinomicrobium oceani TaxID=1150368 RepID=A0A1K1RM01_9FLAO|nr:hypothetical protein SAMN02927921_03753 [Sinomicrobium oceani]
MLLAQGIVTAIAGYFFYKVMVTPPKQEPDSYAENDDEIIRQE